MILGLSVRNEGHQELGAVTIGAKVRRVSVAACARRLSGGVGGEYPINMLRNRAHGAFLRDARRANRNIKPHSIDQADQRHRLLTWIEVDAALFGGIPEQTGHRVVEHAV